MFPFEKYTKSVLNEMFDGIEVSPILPYNSLEQDRALIQQIEDGNGRISLSGVQPKYSAVVENGIIRLTKKGERGLYILKPTPTASFILDRKYCAINEHLTMQIAKQVYNINTAANCICFFQNGESAYLTRRFDIDRHGRKLQQEDFASIASISASTHGENFKYDALSYEEYAALIETNVKAALVDKLRFFQLVIFNYLVSNDDAHLKNFSLIAYRNNDYVLSPAYDLMNTALHLSLPQIFAPTRGLFKEGMPKGDILGITREIFIEFGKRIGLPIKMIEHQLTQFAQRQDQVQQLINDSFLSDSLKKYYWNTFTYRQKTLSL